MNPVKFVILFIAFIILIIVSVKDYKTRIINPVFPIILAACGAILAASDIFIYGASVFKAVFYFFSGAFTGGVFLLITGLVGKLLFKKETMGGGDIKLMAAMGTIIGWDRVLLSDLFAFFIAALFGIILILCKKADRKSYIPFAPFLSVGVFIAALLPNNIVDFFMSNII